MSDLLGNGYVINDDLTDPYIQALITRNGFTDVTPPDQDYPLYQIQDLDGNVQNCYDMPSARTYLIQKYLIIQNS